MTIEVGDSVIITYTQAAPVGFNISSIIALAAPLAVLGFVFGMVFEGEKSSKPGSGHYSIHGPERERLVDQYGSWAVGRAEAVCPIDDVACVEREAVKLLAAYKKEAVGSYFYWSIEDMETGELFEQGYPYSTQGRAVWGARAFAGKEIPVEHPVTIRIYDVPQTGMERRTEAPVYESKWTRG